MARIAGNQELHQLPAAQIWPDHHALGRGFAADASTALCYFATVLPCKRFHCSPVTLIPGYTNPEFRATG